MFWQGWRTILVSVAATVFLWSGSSELRADDITEMMTAFNQGKALAAKADYQRALAQYEIALKIAPRVFGGPNTSGVGTILNNMALIYSELGQYDKAEPILVRCLKIDEAKYGPQNEEVASGLNNLANVYVKMGQPAKAEPLYQRSLAIRERVYGTNHEQVAQSLNNLGSLYSDLGQYAKAEPLLLRALQIDEATYGPDHLELASNLGTLGMLYKDMRQYDKAAPLLERSLKIRDTNLAADHPDISYSLLALANLRYMQKQYDQAEPLYQRALKIDEDKYGADHLNIAKAVSNLGLLYEKLGQREKARELYERSLAIRLKSIGPNHPSVARVREHLAWLLASLGETAKASEQVEALRRNVRRYVAEVLPVLSDKEQLGFLKEIDEVSLHISLSFGQQHAADPAIAEQSAGWLFNGKAVIQESLAERALLARDNNDPALAAQIKQLLGIRTELAGLSLTTPATGQEAAHRAKLDELDAREQELARLVNQAAGRPAYDDPWVEAAAVRGAVAKDAVLVEFFRLDGYRFDAKPDEDAWIDPHYIAWIVPAADQGRVQVVDLGPAEAIEQAISAARKSLSGVGDKESILQTQGEAAAAAQTRRDLAAVTALVWKPLADKVGAAQHLILSPDGALWLLPWAGLPADEKQALLEKYRIHYVISGRDLIRKTQSAAAKPLSTNVPAIFANPDFDLSNEAAKAATKAVFPNIKFNDNQTRGLRSASSLPKVEQLPFTAIESQAASPSISELVGKEPLNYNARYALESIVKRIVRPKLLLFATHGFFLPDQDTDEPPADASTGTRSATVTSTAMENPLLRCGLLLAGCNSPQAGVDDGILTGLEIVGLDLRGTDLVVLSACETGLGKIRNGQGVAGLRQAFQLAGAKSVVSTLWQVPDRDSALITKDFFANLAAGQSKPEALRNAQLARIAARKERYGDAHPFFWAAWTLTGE